VGSAAGNGWKRCTSPSPSWFRAEFAKKTKGKTLRSGDLDAGPQIYFLELLLVFLSAAT
jgi:hypothetical protein